jgi:hypothetical protein
VGDDFQILLDVALVERDNRRRGIEVVDDRKGPTAIEGFHTFERKGPASPD